MLQLAVAIEGTADAGLITEEETTAAGFFADQRHQHLVRHEGAVVHTRNSTSVLSVSVLRVARYFKGLVTYFACSALEQHPFTTASPATQCIPTREDQVALRKGCDLVNVGGNTTDTSHTHPLNPMTTLTQVQDDQAFEALTDEELESVNGAAAPLVVGVILLYGAWHLHTRHADR